MIRWSRTDYRKNINIFSQCTKDAKIIFSRIQIFFIAALFSNYKWSTVDRMPFINTRCVLSIIVWDCVLLYVDSTVEFVIQPTFTWYCFSGKLGSYRQKDSIMICLEFLTMVYSKRMYLSKYSTLEVKSSLNWK